MRRTLDYTRYELHDDDDVGTLLNACLTEMAESAAEKAFKPDAQDLDVEGMRKNAEYLANWNPSKEEMARWCTLLYSQWLLGKFEEDTGVELNSEKNSAIKKYLDSRTPQIFAYIEAGCPGYGTSETELN